MNVDLTQLHGRRVCVALSGGRDSVCLLHVLRACAGKEGITLSALTCEHGIRGEESLADLAFTERLCRDWGVPLRVFRADVPALARVRKQGLEEAGRNFRYACFEQILAEGAADVVATAHHLDDAAETVLFRLARGTSLAGLNVFPARQGIARPFLGVTRAEIDRYMERFRLPFAEDKSNSDERFSRNLLRSRVMPALADIVPNAAEHIAAFAVRASEDDAYLRSLACAALTERGGAVCVPVGLPAPVFSRACLAALAACAAAFLCGCYNGGQFTAGSYTTKEGGVESVVIDVSDRAVELSVAETEVATVEYWQSESEYYDITFSEGTLTIRLVLDKTWTDYIGTKPAEEYRQLKVAIPQGVAQVTVKTTNEQLKISGVEAETLAAENNGGNIVVEGSGADAVSLTAKTAIYRAPCAERMKITP